MGSVDQADQSRKYYNRETRQYRTWRPLFKFLLQSSVCNATKLWIEARPISSQRSQTLRFRIDVALSLLSRTKAASKGLRGVPTSLQPRPQSRPQLLPQIRLQALCEGPSLIG